MMRKERAERGTVRFYQAYGGAEILGGCAARAEDVYFLFREDTGAQRGGTRGHADHYDPAGRRHERDGLGQDSCFAAGLDHQRRAVAVGPVRYLGVEILGWSPGHTLGAQPLGQVAAARDRVDRDHPRARLAGGERGGQADRPGAEYDGLLAGVQVAAGQGVHGDRGGLDEGRAVGVQVIDAEHGAGGDPEAWLQAAVEGHADQAEPRAYVGPPGPARIAAAAGQQRPDGDPVAFGHGRIAGIFDERGHLVALNPGIEVAGAGKRGHVAGKQVEVRSADTHRLRPDDNVSGTGRSRTRNVLDHHLTG